MLDRSRGGFLGGGNAGGTITGDITMAAGKVIYFDPGTTAAPGIASTAQTNTGISALSNTLYFSRSGSVLFGIDGGNTSTVSLNAQNTSVGSAFQRGIKAVQTAGYAQATTDAVIPMNGVDLTLTLLASPITRSELVVYNLAATALTVARNGNNINGAASDLTVPAGKAALMHFLTGTGWLAMVGA